MAEGVETRQQFDHMAETGCTELQGYCFSKPVAEAKLAAARRRIERRGSRGGRNRRVRGAKAAEQAA